MSRSESGMRVDQWLWFTRFFKTRTLATASVKAGHVKVNGERAKPGTQVGPGDRIDLLRSRLPYVLIVVSIPRRRGPAAEARTCYSESDESVAARQSLVDGLRSDRLQMPTTDGRPDKRTRRALRDRQRSRKH